MKQSLILIASLALGTGAIAQDTPPATNGGAMPTAPTGTDSMTPGQAMTPQTPDSSAPPAAPDTATPPATDSTMAPPAGGTGMSSTPPMATADTSSYPKCSRTVTDKCVSSGGMMHHTMAHRHPH